MVTEGIKGREEIYEALVEAGHQVTQLPINEDMDTCSDTPYFDLSERSLL